MASTEYESIKDPCPCPVIATQAEAIAGTDNTKFMTPLRTMQEINYAEVWNVVTTAGAHTMTAGQNYISTYAGQTEFTLPLVSAVGKKINIITTAGGILISQNASQTILVGSLGLTTAGATGSLARSTDPISLTLVCIVANTRWVAVSSSLNGTETLTLDI